MSIIQVDNLTFSYDGSTSYDLIFDDVSFRIDSDWKLGFIGRNGRGKTTFFNILMGKLGYQGTITSTVEFDMFPVQNIDENCLVSEIFKEHTLCEGGTLCEEWEIRKEMNLIELSEDVFCRPYKTLSNGEQTKVQVIILFLKQNNFLLLDEPTNHLDFHGRNHLLKYLQKKRSFIIISHDRVFLDELVDHILSINRCGIDVINGNYSVWNENNDRQNEFEISENIKIEKELKRLETARRQSKNWSDKVEASKWGDNSADSGFIGHKAAKMMKRSKNLENRQNKRVEEKSSLLKNIENSESLKMFPVDFHSDPLVECSELSLGYNGNSVFENLSFSVKKADRVRLSGGNGSGKTSILRALIEFSENGEMPKWFSGRLQLRKGLKISYIPQDVSFLTGSLDDFIASHGLDESLFKAVLRKLDFERVQFEKDMASYSAGQKRKVFLAKSLVEPAHLYIWDEPLNFIDIYSKIQIEDVVLKFAPTIIFVEHDTAFSKKIMTKDINL